LLVAYLLLVKGNANADNYKLQLHTIFHKTSFAKNFYIKYILVSQSICSL